MLSCSEQAMKAEAMKSDRWIRDMVVRCLSPKGSGFPGDQANYAAQQQAANQDLSTRCTTPFLHSAMFFRPMLMPALGSTVPFLKARFSCP